MKLLQILDVIEIVAPDGDPSSLAVKVLLVEVDPLSKVALRRQEPARNELLLKLYEPPDSYSCRGCGEKDNEDFYRKFCQKSSVQLENFF